eukprot:TRINITY_DN25309_c0_g1_i2.p1 TRINITY_DN25309_c0_g1~~TRINITY_DN25309_c0_g1_i2.p1  ORF type:complete len:456 (-),score=61.15 TRINITY_DN25309_c0_g1_i2:434-1801(-)
MPAKRCHIREILHAPGMDNPWANYVGLNGGAARPRGDAPVIPADLRFAPTFAGIPDGDIQFQQLNELVRHRGSERLHRTQMELAGREPGAQGQSGPGSGPPGANAGQMYQPPPVSHAERPISMATAPPAAQPTQAQAPPPKAAPNQPVATQAHMAHQQPTGPQPAQAQPPPPANLFQTPAVNGNYAYNSAAAQAQYNPMPAPAQQMPQQLPMQPVAQQSDQPFLQQPGQPVPINGSVQYAHQQHPGQLPYQQPGQPLYQQQYMHQPQPQPLQGPGIMPGTSAYNAQPPPYNGQQPPPAGLQGRRIDAQLVDSRLPGHNEGADRSRTCTVVATQRFHDNDVEWYAEAGDPICLYNVHQDQKAGHFWYCVSHPNQTKKSWVKENIVSMYEVQQEWEGPNENFLSLRRNESYVITKFEDKKGWESWAVAHKWGEMNQGRRQGYLPLAYVKRKLLLHGP